MTFYERSQIAPSGVFLFSAVIKLSISMNIENSVSCYFHRQIDIADFRPELEQAGIESVLIRHGDFQQVGFGVLRVNMKRKCSP